MKVRTTFVIFTLCEVAVVLAHAQYQASGYRPPGPKFELPKRPQNQYGAPELSSATSLPTLQPIDFRGGQQNFLGEENQRSYANNQNFLTQSNTNGLNSQRGYFDQNNYRGTSPNQENEARFGSVGNQQYGAPGVQPDDTVSIQSNRNRFAGVGNNQRNYFDQNYGGSQLGTSRNQKSDARFRSNNQYGFEQNNNRANQQYGARGDDAVTIQANGGRINQQGNAQRSNQPNRQRLYQTANGINHNAEDFSRNADDEDVVGTAKQIYLPPMTTERLDEGTTRRPNTQEPVEDDEPVNPNIVVANAFARGQYYVLQPNGNVQRVVYQASQSDDEIKSNGYSAKLVYQNVAPITAPIYSYNSPLIRLY